VSCCHACDSVDDDGAKDSNNEDDDDDDDKDDDVVDIFDRISSHCLVNWRNTEYYEN
jgi:hypothetical protein